MTELLDEPVSSPPSTGTLISDATTPTHVRPRPPPGPPRLAPRLPTQRLPTPRLPAIHRVIPDADRAVSSYLLGRSSDSPPTRRAGASLLSGTDPEPTSRHRDHPHTLRPSRPDASSPWPGPGGFVLHLCAQRAHRCGPTVGSMLPARASGLVRDSYLVPRAYSASCLVPLLSRAPPASRAPLASSSLQPAAHSSPEPQPRPIALTRP